MHHPQLVAGHHWHAPSGALSDVKSPHYVAYTRASVRSAGRGKGYKQTFFFERVCCSETSSGNGPWFSGPCFESPWSSPTKEVPCWFECLQFLSIESRLRDKSEAFMVVFLGFYQDPRNVAELFDSVVGWISAQNSICHCELWKRPVWQASQQLCARRAFVFWTWCSCSERTEAVSP